ncbi:MAG: hypothetical protein JF630_11085 [Geodermatophilales bacterium]|nr:hypothetical protein [Geodermatophilales bacterium]
MLGAQAGGGPAALELGGGHHPAGQRRTDDSLAAVEQAVEDVVHERGDDDLVHRLEADRVDRRPRRRPGCGRADLTPG